MGCLSTHVLDTAHGGADAGMRVALQRVDADGGGRTLRVVTLTHDGRSDGGPLLGPGEMEAGRWRLLFEVAEYFRARPATARAALRRHGGHRFRNRRRAGALPRAFGGQPLVLEYLPRVLAVSKRALVRAASPDKETKDG